MLPRPTSSLANVDDMSGLAEPDGVSNSVDGRGRGCTRGCTTAAKARESGLEALSNTDSCTMVNAVPTLGGVEVQEVEILPGSTIMYYQRQTGSKEVPMMRPR